MGKTKNILFVIGTRPELIKVAPVILELKRLGNVNYKIVNTAQHKDLLDPFWNVFGIKPDFILDFMVPNQSLSELTGRAFVQFQSLLDKLENKPDVILAQGDTTSVMVSSVVSFYNNIRFAHLEAGLRTYDYQNPFPEEFNRRVTGLVTQIHFAPTSLACENLRKEGIDGQNIFLVGNTVVDTLDFIRRKEEFNSPFKNPILQTMEAKEYIVITCHRRENQGENLKEILETIRELTTEYKEFNFIWLLHPNPNVKMKVTSALAGIPDLIFCEPLDYIELLKLISKSKLIITDSGGLQEEAPSFSKPVIVMREKTERPESVNVGCSVLTGANKSKIISSFKKFIEQDMRIIKNPYGDGEAAKRIVEVLFK